LSKFICSLSLDIFSFNTLSVDIAEKVLKEKMSNDKEQMNLLNELVKDIKIK
jgi:hypothetical protein